MLRASLFFVRASQVESYLDCDLSPLSVPPPHNSFIVAGADGSWEVFGGVVKGAVVPVPSRIVPPTVAPLQHDGHRPDCPKENTSPICTPNSALRPLSSRSVLVEPSWMAGRLIGGRECNDSPNTVKRLSA
jgi:hypothetical protein